MYVCVSLVWCSLFLVASTTYYCNQNSGYTAMIWAAMYGHKDIVEYLVSQGADKDIMGYVSARLLLVHLYKMIYLYICICIS